MSSIQAPPAKRKEAPIAKARIAGILYLVIAILAGFAHYWRTNYFLSGDAIAIAKRIMASVSLFRITIVSDLAGQVCHVFLILALYDLLKIVNRRNARLMAVLALIPVPMACINMNNQVGILALLGGDNYLKTFDIDQIGAHVMFLLNSHTGGVLIAQIFWGLWLFPLGHLVFRSRFLPRALGGLLALGGMVYVFGSLLYLQFPKIASAFQAMYGVPAVAEIVFSLWLIVRGMNKEEWQKSAPGFTE